MESEQRLDGALAELNAAKGGLHETQGLLDFTRWQLECTIIRSPIEGIVLEKLAEGKRIGIAAKLRRRQGVPVQRCSPWRTLMTYRSRSISTKLTLRKSRLVSFAALRLKLIPSTFTTATWQKLLRRAIVKRGSLQVNVQVRTPERYLIPERESRFSNRSSFCITLMKAGVLIADHLRQKTSPLRQRVIRSEDCAEC